MGNAIFHNVTFGGYVDFSETDFRDDAAFHSVTFSGYADFSEAIFSGDADFGEVNFSGDASFFSVTFSGDADFGNTTFNGKTDFSHSTFTIRARFVRTTMKSPAVFSDVHFIENTMRAGLWNHILLPLFLPIVRLFTMGKVKLPKKMVTDFSEFNTNTTMDGSSNPYLKRYIEDEQWVKSWRGRSKLHQVLFIFWELTSHCGKSILLWAGWSTAVTVTYGFIYWYFLSSSIVFSVGKLDGIQPGFLAYLYYSIVTSTTLGFGDLVPLTNVARLVVSTEVILGYFMLGGLISIFANKFARRS